MSIDVLPKEPGMTDREQIAIHKHLLGTMPDPILAGALSVKFSIVEKERRRLGIAKFRRERANARRVRPEFDLLPQVKERPSHPPAPPKPPPNLKGSKLDGYEHLLGQKTDAEVAAIVGLSVAAVGNHRRRLGIPSMNERLKAEGKPPPKPKVRRKVKRRSKLDPYMDVMGTVPDIELAEKLGLTVAAVGSFRRKKGIPSYQERRKAEREAVPMVEAAPESESLIEAMTVDPPGETEATEVAPVMHEPAQAKAEPTLAWQVRIMGMSDMVVIVAPTLPEAAVKASTLGVGRVVGLEELGRFLG